jgi:hypothetical protein
MNYLKILFIFLLEMILLYLAFWFVTLEPNFVRWDFFSRLILVELVFGLWVITIFYFSLYNLSKND